MANKKTAIMVIHGVGPHQPFEVCDSFARGFYTEYKRKYPQASVTMHHKLKKRKDWIQNHISISSSLEGETIDIYEYFWDIYMLHKVTLNEAFQLLIRASKNANRFYEKNKASLHRAIDIGAYGRRRKLGVSSEQEFQPGSYLKILGFWFILLIKIMPYLPGLLWLLDKWSQVQLPVVNHAFKGLVLFVEKAAQDFVGDAVRYLDLDPRSKHFETRQKIIKGAVEELSELMRDDYEQIIIAGHSLGSVISYDTLNRILQRINAKGKSQPVTTGKEEEVELTVDHASKIIGLVTFGSPLDKIAFFFRERAGEEKDIQRQILAYLHGFRALFTKDEKIKIQVQSSMPFQLEKMRWLNFYHQNDLMSGYLDLYKLTGQPLKNPEWEGDGNILVTEEISRLRAHSCYWGEHPGEGKGTNQMYADILTEFF